MITESYTTKFGYKLFVDDNFHYMEEDARHYVGLFESYDEALAKARSILESSVRKMEGKTAPEILDSYKSFGDDPFIRPVGGAPQPKTAFSAWKYAEEVAREVADERAGNLADGKSERKTVAPHPDKHPKKIT